MSCRLHAYARPSRTRGRPGWRVGGRRSPTRIASSATITARNEIAFTKNTHDGPTDAISTPAIAGPVIRAEFATALLSATALASLSRPTISSTNAWRAGSSTTVTSPSAIASPNTIHTLTTSVSTSNHSTIASSAMRAWVTSRTLRRSKWSATAPPHSPKSNTGRNRQAKVAPTATPLPVSDNTSHASAIVCIHEPMYEMSSPPK